MYPTDSQVGVFAAKNVAAATRLGAADQEIADSWHCG